MLGTSPTVGAPRSPWCEMRPGRAGRVRLFCFAHAGGSEVAFAGWQEQVASGVEIVPILLPGRGRRVAEPLARALTDVADTIATSLVEALDRPFAFFGHSMGALLAFEVARKLRAHFGVSPALLIVAACAAPAVRDCTRQIHLLDDDGFADELRKLRGTPDDLLRDLQAMQMLMPVIRADFKMAETYRYEPGPPLTCPVLAFGGIDDDIEPAKLNAWRSETRDRFSLELMCGDHFFVQSHSGELLAHISSALRYI